MEPSARPAHVAFLGLSVMGATMAANVVKAGFTLTVHNRSRGKAAALEEAGARWAATPAEAVTHAAAVCICLPDTPDVEVVLFGPEGIASSVPHGAIVVDFSTIAAVPTAISRDVCSQ